MKKILIAFSIILCFILCSCNYDDANIVYKGSAWEIHKINDSVLLCIPWQASGDSKPYLIDLNQFKKNNNNITSEQIFEEGIIDE